MHEISKQVFIGSMATVLLFIVIVGMCVGIASLACGVSSGTWPAFGVAMVIVLLVSLAVVTVSAYLIGGNHV